MDWEQLLHIATLPDNIPVLMLMVLVPVYLWIAFRQAFANDRLIRQLENDPALAKTHHRTAFPYKKEWPKLVHVWPHLLKIEFLVALIVLVILIVWSIAIDAPLEEPANPTLTMNPAKAPWYFLGLQEMLVYFDPWIAGVALPGLILGGLMAIPYCDVNPFGNGYYTWSQRKFSWSIFFFGFLGLWLVMTFVGVFIRGPGWMWFWPGQTWNHHRVDDQTYIHLFEVFGLEDDPKGNFWPLLIFGVVVIGAYFSIGAMVIHFLYKKLKPENYRRMNIFQYSTMIALLLFMFALPVKMLLWNMGIKYVMRTPWFNI